MSIAPEPNWFVEDGDDRYVPPPDWVFDAIDLGLQSMNVGAAGRPFFGLVSTPCDSSFAGLVALGAQLRVLYSPAHFPRAVDPGRYFQFLWDLRQGTRLRCRTKGVKLYELQADGQIPGPVRNLRVWRLGQQSAEVFHEAACLAWQPVDGACGGSEVGGYDSFDLPEERPMLQELASAYSIATEPLPDERLRFNYPETVLVGPAGGLPGFRHAYEERFRFGITPEETQFPLSQLLRLRGTLGSGDHCAWRGVHINPLSRDAVADARAAAPRARLAIFHGAEAFLKLGDYFRKCDRILVASRDIANGVLESLCSKLYQDRRDGGEVEEDGSSWLPPLRMVQGFRYRRRQTEVAL